MFASAEETEGEDDAQESDDENESGVLPKSVVKSLKENRKALNGDLRDNNKTIKALNQDIKKLEKLTSRHSRAGGNPEEYIKQLNELEKANAQLEKDIADIDTKLEQHNALDKQLKDLKAGIKAAEKQKDDLVEAARAKIAEGEARQLILERFRQLLFTEYEAYIRQYQQAFIAAIENLWNKYSVTVKQILEEREKEAALFDQFMVELGYE